MHNVKEDKTTRASFSFAMRCEEYIQSPNPIVSGRHFASAFLSTMLRPNVQRPLSYDSSPYGRMWRLTMKQGFRVGREQVVPPRAK